MKVQTSRFGEIEVQPEQVITFAKRILAFEEYKEFILLPADEKEETSFYFLQSVEDKDVCFFLLDTLSFFPEYDIEIDQTTVNELDIKEPEEVFVSTIITVKGNLQEATTNLKAPLVINVAQKEGKQIVLEQGNYLIKQPLFSQSHAQNAKKTQGKKG
jgi:flagellar assembly factor FliW